jgi:homoserine dehydrogenase
MGEPIGITLLGCGTIGRGVVKVLTQQRDLIQQRTGLSLDLRFAVDRDTSIDIGRPISPDAHAAIDDPRTHIVVELIGGTGVAGQFIQRALSLGKPVVTANKSLLASRGKELFSLARKHDTLIAFEASCGGGIPIIDALTRGLVANRIDALLGIVNGTCNVILTRMTKNGWTYPEALAEAQRAGFAEADPTLDVSGRDAAQKLALLASLAFNVTVAERDIHVEGVDKLQATDIGFARDLGYVIKLLAIAERHAGDKLTLRVHPTLVHRDDVLAEVSGSFNAISVFGHALGHALFYGRGAGQMPTASAVVADIVDVALGSRGVAFRQQRIYPDTTPAANVLPIEELESRYYLRLSARDVPGVLADVTASLGRHGISLSAVLQRESNDSQIVPVVITTHRAREGSVRKALAEIDALATISSPTVCLRIIDQPKEFAGV